MRFIGSVLVAVGVVLTCIALALLASGPTRTMTEAEKEARQRRHIETVRFEQERESDPKLQAPRHEKTREEVHREGVILRLYVSTAVLFGGLSLVLLAPRRRSRKFIAPLPIKSR